MQNISDLTLATSRRLNKVFFGAGMQSEVDPMSQLNAISMGYLVNLAMTFIVIAGVAFALGYCDPFHSPLLQGNFVRLVAFSNVAAFALTFVASLEWTLHGNAAQRRKEKSSVSSFLILGGLLLLGAAFFLLATYLALGFGVLLCSIVTNSGLILFLISRREMGVQRRGAS